MYIAVRVERRRQQDAEVHTLRAEQTLRSLIRMMTHRLCYLSGSRQWFQQIANRTNSGERRESDFDRLGGIRSIRRLE